MGLWVCGWGRRGVTMKLSGRLVLLSVALVLWITTASVTSVATTGVTSGVTSSLTNPGVTSSSQRHHRHDELGSGAQSTRQVWCPGCANKFKGVDDVRDEDFNDVKDATRRTEDAHDNSVEENLAAHFSRDGLCSVSCVQQAADESFPIPDSSSYPASSRHVTGSHHTVTAGHHDVQGSHYDVTTSNDRRRRRRSIVDRKYVVNSRPENNRQFNSRLRTGRRFNDRLFNSRSKIQLNQLLHDNRLSNSRAINLKGRLTNGRLTNGRLLNGQLSNGQLMRQQAAAGRLTDEKLISADRSRRATDQRIISDELKTSRDITWKYSNPRYLQPISHLPHHLPPLALHNIPGLHSIPQLGLHSIPQHFLSTHSHTFFLPSRPHHTLPAPPLLHPSSVNKRKELVDVYSSSAQDGGSGGPGGPGDPGGPDFSEPPRFYPEDGPKRNWRANLMRVWGR